MLETIKAPTMTIRCLGTSSTGSPCSNWVTVPISVTFQQDGKTMIPLGKGKCTECSARYQRMIDEVRQLEESDCKVRKDEQAKCWLREKVTELVDSFRAPPAMVNTIIELIETRPWEKS